MVRCMGLSAWKGKKPLSHSSVSWFSFHLHSIRLLAIWPIGEPDAKAQGAFDQQPIAEDQIYCTVQARIIIIIIIIILSLFKNGLKEGENVQNIFRNSPFYCMHVLWFTFACAHIHYCNEFKNSWMMSILIVVLLSRVAKYNVCKRCPSPRWGIAKIFQIKVTASMHCTFILISMCMHLVLWQITL